MCTDTTWLDLWPKMQFHHVMACVAGHAYSDPGATAYDAVDGAITSIVTTGVSAINTMVVRTPTTFCLSPA